MPTGQLVLDAAANDEQTRDAMTLSRLLDTTEIRVLGSLLEKQQATPEYYPLTLNALVAACNQRTNREPVTDLTEKEVTAALQRLQDDRLVWSVVGGRATRYDHNLDAQLSITAAGKAVLTLLMLRGAQTAGEIRSRSERLFVFDSIEQVESTLEELASREAPPVAQLERRPGQKETRWAHRLGESVATVTPSEASPQPTRTLADRIDALEERVSEIEVLLRDLREKLGE